MEIRKKIARENFIIGAFYNITKNQDNPIKTVGRDSFLSPKTPTKTSFKGSPSPQRSYSPYVLEDTTRPRHITCVLVWSKSDQRRLRKTLHKQTDKQTNRHYENNGHLAVNQKKHCLCLYTFDSHRTKGTYTPCKTTPISSFPAARTFARFTLRKQRLYHACAWFEWFT